MKFPETGKQLSASVLLSAGLLLTACGGGDGGSTSSNGITSISGTAATGAAMTSGTVSLSCKDSLTRTAAISPTGTWSTTVPSVNLPCAVKASDGTNTYYSFTVGNGSSIVTNVTPLTTLALAQILGAAPSALFATLSATDLAKLNDTAINAAISALNTVLASYALPANFNPVTTPLTAAAPGQAGNAYDGLLDQFGDANTDLATLVTQAATGILPTLPAPSYTAGADSHNGFFTRFAGDYSLKVTAAGAEGSNNSAATSLFPLNSARTVHIKANGDVVIDAVGRSITWAASTYNGSVGVGKWKEFDGTASTQNIIRYRQSSTIDLYITYDPATGELSVTPQGFANNEGYADLKGRIVAPPAALPLPQPPTVTSFTPTSGAVGSTVTLTGTGFSTTLANNVVRFSSNTTGPAPQATVVSASSTQLVVTVPAGAVTGQLTVYNTAVEAVVSSASSFTVSSGGDSGGSTPTTKAGQIAAAFGAGFSGTYSLTCSGSAHTVTINTDGSSLLDGSTLLGSSSGSEYGGMEIASANTITGKYYVFIHNDQNTSRAYLNFTGNTLDSVDIGLPGQNQQACTLASPGPDSRFDRLAAIKRLAPLTTNLSCTASNQTAKDELADGTQTFSLATDGSLTLGGISANTTQTSLSSVVLAFSSQTWTTPSFNSGVSAAGGATGYRAVNARFASDGSITSVKFSISGSSYSDCAP